MSIHTIAAYVQLVNLPETPTIAIAAAIILVCCLCVINGPEVMGRIAKSLAFIFVTFSFFTIAIGLKDMRFSNLLPVLTTGIKPLMNAAFSMYTLPLAEGILCLSLFSSVEENISVKKVILKAFFVSLATFLSISLRNILILGVPASQEFYFPSYDAIRVLSIGDFFTRFEVFIGINLLLAGIIKIGVCLYASSLGLTKILSLKSQRSLVVPCALLIVTVSQNLYANIQRMVEFIQVYKYFALPFETLLPAMILIGAEIQMRWKSGGTKKADPSAPQTEQ